MTHSDSYDRKLLILILDSDTEPVYAGLRALWHSFLKRASIPHYFLNSDRECNYESTYPVIRSPYFVDYARRVTEATRVGLALSLKEARYCRFSHVLRTNLSSIFNLSRLLDLVGKLQINNCYAGPDCWIYVRDEGIHFPFRSGAGIFLSLDMVERAVNSNNASSAGIFDDVWLGTVMNGINQITTEMYTITDLSMDPSTRIPTIAAHLSKISLIKPYHVRIKNYAETLRLRSDLPFCNLIWHELNF